LLAYIAHVGAGVAQLLFVPLMTRMIIMMMMKMMRIMMMMMIMMMLIMKMIIMKMMMMMLMMIMTTVTYRGHKCNGYTTNTHTHTNSMLGCNPHCLTPTIASWRRGRRRGGGGGR
jgi:hypothetical protein